MKKFLDHKMRSSRELFILIRFAEPLNWQDKTKSKKIRFGLLALVIMAVLIVLIAVWLFLFTANLEVSVMVHVQ